MPKAPAPTPVRLHPNLAALYREKVAALSAALADDDLRAEAFEILRTLIEAVLLHPAGTGAPHAFEVELVGGIARMVEVALDAGQGRAGDKKAAPGGAALSAEDRRSVKVVAGAGFEPATFRL